MSFQTEPVQQSADTSLSLSFSSSLRVSHLLGFRGKSIAILAAALQPSICPPLPMDIYSAGFLDDAQDEALSREHSLCLIWVSGLSSPGGHKEGTKQIAFKAFNKSEYTFLTV